MICTLEGMYEFEFFNFFFSNPNVLSIEGGEIKADFLYNQGKWRESGLGWVKGKKASSHCLFPFF